MELGWHPEPPLRCGVPWARFTLQLREREACVQRGQLSLFAGWSFGLSVPQLLGI